VFEALVRHPGAFLEIMALRLCELLTMYIVTAFVLNYSTQNVGLSRELFLNIGLLVGGISCVTIPLFAWLADRYGRRRINITGVLLGDLSAFPFYCAGSPFDNWCRYLFSDAGKYRSRDGGLCPAAHVYRIICRGLSLQRRRGGLEGRQRGRRWVNPFIAAALLTYSGGEWHSVATYLMVGCLLSAFTAIFMKSPQPQ